MTGGVAMENRRRKQKLYCVTEEKRGSVFYISKRF